MVCFYAHLTMLFSFGTKKGNGAWGKRIRGGKVSESARVSGIAKVGNGKPRTTKIETKSLPHSDSPILEPMTSDTNPSTQHS
jgi:hypothetical protein